MRRLLWAVILVADAYGAGFLTHMTTVDHSTKSLRAQDAVFAKEKECKAFGDKERAANPTIYLTRG
jgi:hypothetical protein